MRKIIRPWTSACISVSDESVAAPGDALSKAELNKAELELEVNKAKLEEARLQDTIIKMQALNEGLGQDKIELNKIIMHVRVYVVTPRSLALKDGWTCNSL